MQGFIDFLDMRIKECRERVASLAADGRRDDADFAKVRANIYEVCRTVSAALAERPGAGREAIEAQFARFGSIWGAALEKAREHGDARAAAVEEIKLEALGEIRARFAEAEA